MHTYPPKTFNGNGGLARFLLIECKRGSEGVTPTTVLDDCWDLLPKYILDMFQLLKTFETCSLLRLLNLNVAF